MRKYLLALLAAALVGGAVFLPGQLSQWGDRVLLDVPHILQEAEREGFAESIQLSVAEKLLLMRSGAIERVYVGEDQPAAGLVTNSSSVNASAGEWVEFYYETEEAALSETESAAVDSFEQANSAKWSQRLQAAQTEVRTLQALGALPELWAADSEIEFVGYDQMIYIDRSTQVSFQVYSISLSCAPYSLDLTVDAQSGRVLSFYLSWSQSEELNWGMRGASGFGTAWRDYWGLDSVSGGWYNDYNRSILEDAVKLVRKDGDYNANSQIPFTYNERTLNIPLVNWASGSRGYSLLWNR